MLSEKSNLKVKTIVSECIDNSEAFKQLITTDDLHKVHVDYENRTTELKKCISFY
jgi:hypothetical protein